MSSNKLAIIESQFIVNYNHPENGVTVGGTQRYAHQLGELFVRLGYRVVFLAKACKEVSFEYENIGTVVTLSARFGSLGNRVFSGKVYDYAVKANADIVCYSDLQLAYWKCYPKSFALQHGIDWDGPNTDIRTKINNYIYIKAARKFSKIVCVDTNYINWARMRDKQYFSDPGKYVYVPNFAKCENFPYQYKEWKRTEPFTLLYPRRMVKHRGFDLFIAICEKLYALGYNIKPVLAIEVAAHDLAVERIRDCKCHYTIIHPSMSEIGQEYPKAFLTYVPTLWSEGTSLSAIESICSGCPVLVTDVGGLGNIVIPGYNGEILPYDVDAFVEASVRLMENPDERNTWAQNCESLRTSFDVGRWNRCLEKVINQVSGNQPEV